jgi:hypothetical protein
VILEIPHSSINYNRGASATLFGYDKGPRYIFVLNIPPLFLDPLLDQRPESLLACRNEDGTLNTVKFLAYSARKTEESLAWDRACSCSPAEPARALKRRRASPGVQTYWDTLNEYEVAVKPHEVTAEECK